MTVSGAEWTIRLGPPEDAPILARLNCAMAVETEGKELAEDRVLRGVQRGLQQGDEVTYWVAATSERIVGMLMLTREWSDWRDGWMVWIQSVYVEPDFRERGVFRSLLEHSVTAARLRPDIVGVRLYVEAQNERAQAVYRKTGFDDPNYMVMEQVFGPADGASQADASQAGC